LACKIEEGATAISAKSVVRKHGKGASTSAGAGGEGQTIFGRIFWGGGGTLSRFELHPPGDRNVSQGVNWRKSFFAANWERGSPGGSRGHCIMKRGEQILSEWGKQGSHCNSKLFGVVKKRP